MKNIIKSKLAVITVTVIGASALAAAVCGIIKRRNA
jgi:hypothetical protein